MVVEQIKDLMALDRITITELANRAGKSVQNMSTILKGNAKIETLEELCNLMGYEIKVVKGSEKSLEERVKAIESRLNAIEG